MSKKYVVAIPSYHREEVLPLKTLKTLVEGKVDPKCIHIFVANESEKKKYEKAVPSEMYGAIIVGKPGISKQRRFIIQYFPEKTPIVSIDDDVEGVFQLSGEKLAKIGNLDKFYETAFSRLEKEKLFVWGIYPVHNPFFMKPTVTTDLKFILGTMYGFINRHDAKLKPSLQCKEKEDVEMSLLYYLKDGGVLRFNQTTVKTKFHAKGGLGEESEERFKNNQDSADYLAKKYPDLVTIFHRKNGMAEIRMARKPRM
jgi:hypothetical protein